MGALHCEQSAFMVESLAYAYRPWQKASPPGQYLPFLAPFTDALQRLAWFVFSWLGYPPPPPDSGSQWWQFLGARMIVADVSYMLILGLFLWLSRLFILFLLRALLRNEWAAAIAMVLLVTALTAAGSRFDPVAIVGILIFSSLAVFVMLRFGLLALVANVVVFNILQNFPLTTQWSAWYSGIGLAGILLIAGYTSGTLATLASPDPTPVTVQIPALLSVVAVLNLDTRTPVAYTAFGQQITFTVADDPIELLLEPTTGSQ
jgi:hypothetical protein